ncbi:MAG: GIY-YIG nuclease family protein [Aggregatilineales bacterium]
MAEAATVKIFLADGSTKGILTAEIFNWTGRITVAPRTTHLATLLRRPELERTGLYVLVSDDIPAKIYVGESDNIVERLRYHAGDDKKDFWVNTVVVTSKDENLTKAHVRYLEAKLIKIANEAKNSDVANGTSPEPTPLPESDRADMDSFLEKLLMLFPLLGFSFTTSVVEKRDELETILTTTTKSLSPLFQMTYGGTNAKARLTENDFLVLKGSTVRIEETASLAQSYRDKRKDLFDKGLLVDAPDSAYWLLNADVKFSSPSTAATIVAGSSRNGRTEWKVEGSNQTYGEWDQAQLEAATASLPTTE